MARFEDRRARLAEAFRTAYEGAGLTQVDLESKLKDRGVHQADQSTISKWKRGERPIPLDVLPVVDELCGQPLGYVLRLAGYVEAVDTRGAIMTDPHLQPAMREALATMYDGLRNGAPESGSDVAGSDGDSLRAAL